MQETVDEQVRRLTENKPRWSLTGDLATPINETAEKLAVDRDAWPVEVMLVSEYEAVIRQIHAKVVFGARP
jgi:hypothetical protein